MYYLPALKQGKTICELVLACSLEELMRNFKYWAISKNAVSSRKKYQNHFSLLLESSFDEVKSFRSAKTLDSRSNHLRVDRKLFYFSLLTIQKLDTNYE